MKRPLWLAATVCVLGTQLAAQNVEAEIRRLEDERGQAMLRRDAAALDRILADDLTYTHSSGRVDTKPDFIRSYTATDQRYVAFDRDNVRVRVYGDAAVVTGTAKVHVKSDTRDAKFEIRFVDVYVRRNGRWQMVAWQSTRIEPL